MSKTIKVVVYEVNCEYDADTDTYDSSYVYAKVNDPIVGSWEKRGFDRVGVVEIERVGVVWGTPGDVQSIVEDRVEHEIAAGRVAK